MFELIFIVKILGKVLPDEYDTTMYVNIVPGPFGILCPK